jgi:hypothetical protein
VDGEQNQLEHIYIYIYELLNTPCCNFSLNKVFSPIVQRIYFNVFFSQIYFVFPSSPSTEEEGLLPSSFFFFFLLLSIFLLFSHFYMQLESQIYCAPPTRLPLFSTPPTTTRSNVCATHASLACVVKLNCNGLDSTFFNVCLITVKHFFCFPHYWFFRFKNIIYVSNSLWPLQFSQLLGRVIYLTHYDSHSHRFYHTYFWLFMGYVLGSPPFVCISSIVIFSFLFPSIELKKKNH